MTRRHRSVLLGFVLLLGGSSTACTRENTARSVPGMVVIGVAREPTLPLPLLSAHTPDADVSDQLFLRLGNLGDSFDPSGDAALRPMLAESWQRIDSLTLDFTLHPEAHWHDGVLVTARDLVFTWQLVTNPRFNRDQALFEPIRAIEAIDERTVRVHFRRAFQEQLYLVGFTFQPLPAHLLEGIAPDSIGSSDFARHPIGNGPYRFVQRIPGQQVELLADTTFFRGRPGIQRLIFRTAPDATTRLTMFLAGELDLIDKVVPAQVAAIEGRPDVRLVAFPSNTIAYALFNTRSSTDTARPAPILSDVRVRHALTYALDRDNLARAVLGTGALVPDAVRSQAWLWVAPIPDAPRRLAEAQALLDQAGWQASGPDGIRRRNGVPLRLRAIYVPVSAIRNAFALQAQQMWREAGIDVELDAVEGAAYVPRRFAGDWDIEFGLTDQDATPMSLTQSWTCASAAQPMSSNIARWCDPVFDDLLATAAAATESGPAWRATFDRMAEQRPAAVLGAPVNHVAVQDRLTDLTIWPVKAYLSAWQWRIRPEAALPRDR